MYNTVDLSLLDKCFDLADTSWRDNFEIDEEDCLDPQDFDTPEEFAYARLCAVLCKDDEKKNYAN